MPRVSHPTAKGYHRDVSEKALSEWVKAGWLPDATEAPASETPKGNASREEWAEYAERVGVEVTDEMTRDDIRESTPTD